MAFIAITDVPAETHEKLLTLASLRGVPPGDLALELLMEALTAHEPELSRMLKQQLFGSSGEGESDPEQGAFESDE